MVTLWVNDPRDILSNSLTQILQTEGCAFLYWANPFYIAASLFPTVFNISQRYCLFPQVRSSHYALSISTINRQVPVLKLTGAAVYSSSCWNKFCSPLKCYWALFLICYSRLPLCNKSTITILGLHSVFNLEPERKKKGFCFWNFWKQVHQLQTGLCISTQQQIYNNILFWNAQGWGIINGSDASCVI